MKAYKVFNPDFTCRNFKYEIGRTYTHFEPISLCNSGFHACINAVDCFNYYSFNPNNKVCEVELMGNIIHGEDKSVCSQIKIIKEIIWSDVLTMVNTGKNNTGYRNSGNWNSGNWNSGDSNSGNWNSGDSNSGNWNSGDSNSGDRNSGNWNSGDSNSGNWNSGNRNSGDWNSGNRNSGNWNSGNRNSGDWNSCDNESGHFNSEDNDIIRVFNKPCNRKDWTNCQKPDFIYIQNTVWISFSAMSEEEKKLNPKAYVCNGYLKTISYKEAWKDAYSKASEKDIQLLKNLPNFDAKVFEEITGINIES